MSVRNKSILRRIFPQLLIAVPLLCFSSPSLEPDVTLVINTHESFQKMDGFGGCINYYDLIPGYQDPAFYDRIVFDLGLSILRIPLIGHEYFENDNTNPLSFDWDTINEDEMAYVMEIAKQFQARGINEILTTPWSPPGWMKTNRSSILGGRLRPDMREEYAEFLDTYTRVARQVFGVNIGNISLQNESLFVEPYKSCVYNPLQMKHALKAVSRRFEATSNPTQITLSEDMGRPDRFVLYVEPVARDPALNTFKGFYSSHGANGFENWQKMKSLLRPFGRKFWMTETSGHNPDWKGGLAMAENIHDTVAGGDAAAYIYWQVGGLGPGRSAFLASGEYTPKAYAVKHFSRFIRPGALRVQVEANVGSLRTSAFKHPVTEDISIVMINTGNELLTVSLNVVDFELPASWLSFTSTQGEYLKKAEISGNLTITVPANGIVSLIGRSGERLQKLPSLLPEDWIPPSIGKGLAMVGDARLHRAARSNNVGEIITLLEEGLNPNTLNPGGFSPLHRAAYPGHIESIVPLLEGGADPNSRAGDGATPIMIAAGNGHDDFIQNLVKRGALVDLADFSGKTPLHLAAQAGNLHTVQLLVNLGADPDKSDHHGWTALHWAASSFKPSSIQLINFLVKAGADPMKTDEEGMSALHVAASNCVNPGIRQRTPKDQESININARRFQELLKVGIPVNLLDAQGRTALHWISWLGETHFMEDAMRRPSFRYSVEGTRYLLESGADPNIEDVNGLTAENLAAGEGYIETAYLLQNHALHFKSQSRFSSLGSGDKESQKNPSQTVNASLGKHLLRAASSGDQNKIADLLSRGADPNYMEAQGGSALHHAVIAGNLEVIKVLLAAGADPSRKDSDGYSAIERARQNNQTKILKILGVKQ